MSYERLRELLEKWRTEDPVHDEKYYKELEKEMEETHHLTPNMQAFFDKLLELKAYVKERSKKVNCDDSARYELTKVWNFLDAIIKVKQ